MHDTDVIVIGSGIGGLTAAALLSRYGKQVIVCESHTIAPVRLIASRGGNSSLILGLHFIVV